MYQRQYSILDISHMTKDQWRVAQPFYKNLAQMGYFTNHLINEDFYDSFYHAIGHPKPFDVDPDLHLVSHPLYQREIITSLHLLPIPYQSELRILMVNCTYTGLWAVLWRIILHLCYRYRLRKISLMDRSFYGDPWSHYGFSGVLHDDQRFYTF